MREFGAGCRQSGSDAGYEARVGSQFRCQSITEQPPDSSAHVFDHADICTADLGVKHHVAPVLRETSK